MQWDKEESPWYGAIMHFEIHQESGIICITYSPRTEKSPEITNVGLSGIPARADVHCDSGRFAHCCGVYTIVHLQLHSQTFPRMQRQSYAEIWRTDPVNKIWDNLGTAQLSFQKTFLSLLFTHRRFKAKRLLKRKCYTCHLIHGVKVFIQRNNSEQNWWRKTYSEVSQCSHQAENIVCKHSTTENSCSLLWKSHSLQSYVMLCCPYKKLY